MGTLGHGGAARPPSRGAPRLNPPGPAGRFATFGILSPGHQQRRGDPLLHDGPAARTYPGDVENPSLPAGSGRAPLDEQPGALDALVVDRVGNPAVPRRALVEGSRGEPHATRHRDATGSPHAACHLPRMSHIRTSVRLPHARGTSLNSPTSVGQPF